MAIHSSNEQTLSAGDGHVDMALVEIYFEVKKLNDIRRKL
jgi:hypothetical protein